MVKQSRVLCLLSVISVHLYSAEQNPSLFRKKAHAGIQLPPLAENNRAPRKYKTVVLAYQDKKTKQEKIKSQEERQKRKKYIAAWLNPPLVMAGSYRQDLATARSSTSSGSSSAASTPEQSPSITPRTEEKE